MLHPVFGTPVLLTSCTLQQSKYGFAYMVLRAFSASARGVLAGVPHELQRITERILPRVIAASPSCVAMHVELQRCVSSSLFLARVQVSDDYVLYLIRVPWLPMPTSLPKACSFVPDELVNDALVTGGTGVCLELRMRTGASTTYRALRYLPEHEPYVQAVTLPHVLTCPLLEHVKLHRRTYLPFGTHYVVDAQLHAAAHVLTSCGETAASRRISVE